MALRNGKDFTFRPAGVTDTLDGTNSFPGSMAKLRNLCLSYHTPNAFVPRPAAVSAVNLASINASGVVNALLVVGSRVYGMIESTTYPGKDEPFCYDLNAGAFISLTGVASALLPNTPARTGDWAPPTMVAVTNSLIMVTHPGFTGGSNPYIGWIDISNYSSTSMVAGTTSGSKVLTGVVTTIGSSAPILQGVQNGQTVAGAGIPAGAYVTGSTNGTFSLNTTGNTHGSTLLDGLASTTGVIQGTLVSGPQFNPGTYVAAIVSGTSVTLSQAALGTATGTAVNFSGNGTITISANATATSAAPVALTVAGGTTAAPRWGAGNLNTNPLSQVPSCSYGFNGRAYIGVGPYLVYSDPLNPLQVSLATQALVIGDNTPITALAGVPLTSQLTGGVQQSMTVFKGAESLTQITGDALTGDLKQNAVAGSVGTLAPLSIAQTPLGTAYMAVDGLRILGLSGTVSDPIGTGGTGVVQPFLNALYPSRMCAAYAENVYRITVQNGADPVLPFYEYWFDFKSKVWTGPHTCATRMVTAYPTGASFLIAPLAVNSVLQKSDVLPKSSSTFVENGVQLSWTYETSLLPDNQLGAYNRVLQGSLACALATTDAVSVSVVDDTGQTLTSTGIFGSTGGTYYWGSAVWGSALWGGAAIYLRELPMKWPTPILFRQARFVAAGSSAAGQVISNLYFKYAPVGLNVPGR